jgi:hypothetical protein
MEIAGREGLSDAEVEEQVVAFLTDQPKGRAPATSHVREAVSTRSKKVDEALERLKERGEVVDFDAKGRPHSGRPRTSRYWLLSTDAASGVVPLPGTTWDDRDSGSRDGEEAPHEVVRSSRLKGGTTSVGRLRRDDSEEGPTPSEGEQARWEGLAAERNGSAGEAGADVTSSAEGEPPRHRSAVELLAERYAGEDAAAMPPDGNAGKN